MKELETLLEQAAGGPEVRFSAADIERRVRRRSTFRRAGTAILAVPVVVGLTVWGAAAISDSGERRVEVADETGERDVQGGLVGLWDPVAYSAAITGERGAYLEFRREGQLVGSDGCNDFGGKWEVVGDQLIVSETGWTSTCRPARDPGLVEFLNSGPTIGTPDRVVGGSLQLTSGNEFVVFERADSLADAAAEESVTVAYQWCEATAAALPYSAETLQVEVVTAAAAAELHREQEPGEVEPWSARRPDEAVALCTLDLASPPAASDASSERFADGVVRVLTDGRAFTSLPN